MTDPDREHTEDPAEGAEHPGQERTGATPHPEDPAEGGTQTGGGADTPGS